MNERIKLLAEQARKYAWENETHWSANAERERLFEQKFAQLIVGECLGCCEQAISDPVPESVDTWLNGGLQCIQEIKLHFGVEQ